MSHPRKHRNPTAGGFALPAVFAVAFACLLDAARHPESMPLQFLLSLAGMAIAHGLLLGLLLRVVLRGLPRVPILGPWLPWLVGLSTGGYLADQLGVFSRLTGRHQELALVTLAACVGGGIALSVLLWGLRLKRDGKPGCLLRLGGTARIAFTFALLNAGLLALAADHRLYVGLYPSAHVALRASALLLLTLSLSLWRAWPPLREAALPLFLLALFVPTALLTAGADDALQAFAQRPFSSTLLQATRAMFDLDRDGFSALLGGGDCDDRNPNVHPAAREIPDNGIDDNCFFGDASKKIAPITRLPAAQGKSPLNVVLITVDTLRWDRLGLNDPAFDGNGANTMPHVSAWARKGLNLRRAYSAGSWTSIALAALTRGLYARRLSWVPHYETNRFRMLLPHKVDDLRKNEHVAKMFPLAWRDPHPTLSALLQRRGMRTVAVIDDSFSLMLAGDLGCDDGFDNYREVNRGASVRPRFDDEDTARIAIHELKRAAQGEKPFFLWVHFFGPHGPSTSHEGVRIDGDSEAERYDQEVRFVDQQIHKLLSELEPMLDSTAVFLTADHGEDIGQSYRNHGTTAEENLIRVPLVARVPGWPQGATFDHAVSHVDLVPTILSLTRTPAPSDLDGIDLTPLVTGARKAPHRVLLTDAWGFARDGSPYVDLVAAFDGRHKLVLNRRDNGFSRFRQGTMEDKASIHADLLSGPLVNTVMSYVEETGGVVHMEITPDGAPPDDDARGDAYAPQQPRREKGRANPKQRKSALGKRPRGPAGSGASAGIEQQLLPTKAIRRPEAAEDKRLRPKPGKPPTKRAPHGGLPPEAAAP